MSIWEAPWRLWAVPHRNAFACRHLIGILKNSYVILTTTLAEYLGIVKWTLNIKPSWRLPWILSQRVWRSTQLMLGCWTRPAVCLLFYVDLESGGEDLWARSKFRLLVEKRLWSQRKRCVKKWTERLVRRNFKMPIYVTWNKWSQTMVCMEIFPSSKSAATWTKPNTEMEGRYFQFMLLQFSTLLSNFVKVATS